MTKEACEYIAERTERTEADACAYLEGQNANGRLLTPEEVAASILWLSTQEGEVANGEYHVLEGQ